MLNTGMLLRTRDNDKQTFGRILLYDSAGDIYFQCRTLELPWRMNTPFESCIPDTVGAGRYMLKRRWSPEHKSHLAIGGVPGRTNILIHSGNFYRDTTGCVLVGHHYRDIDGDTFKDVVDSDTILHQLLNAFDHLVSGMGTMQLMVISADGVDRRL